MPEGIERGVLLVVGGAVPFGELVEELRASDDSKGLLRLVEMPVLEASALGALLNESTAWEALKEVLVEPLAEGSVLPLAVGERLRRSALGALAGGDALDDTVLGAMGETGALALAVNARGGLLCA